MLTFLSSKITSSSFSLSWKLTRRTTFTKNLRIFHCGFQATENDYKFEKAVASLKVSQSLVESTKTLIFGQGMKHSFLFLYFSRSIMADIVQLQIFFKLGIWNYGWRSSPSSKRDFSKTSNASLFFSKSGMG